jgi:hypothetical protein
MRAWFQYLRAKGVDTDGMSARISRLTKKTLNRALGAILAATAKEERAAA